MSRPNLKRWNNGPGMKFYVLLSRSSKGAFFFNSFAKSLIDVTHVESNFNPFKTLANPGIIRI